MTTDSVRLENWMAFAGFVCLAIVLMNWLFRPLRERCATHPAIGWRFGALLLALQLIVGGRVVLDDLLSPPDAMLRLGVLSGSLALSFVFGIGLLRCVAAPDPIAKVLVLGGLAPALLGWPTLAFVFGLHGIALAVVSPMFFPPLMLLVIAACVALVLLLRAGRRQIERFAEDASRVGELLRLRRLGVAGRGALWCGAALLSALVVCAISWPIRYGDAYYYKAIAQRLRHHTVERIDLQLLQAWGSRRIGLAEGRREAIQVDRNEWPPWLRDANPSAVRIDPSGSARVSWGREMGDEAWGIQTAASMESNQDRHEYRLPISERAYFWYRVAD